MTYNLYIKRYSGWYLTVKPVGGRWYEFPKATSFEAPKSLRSRRRVKDEEYGEGVFLTPTFHL